jgi:propionyl-CoA carboxylase beta chain
MSSKKNQTSIDRQHKKGKLTAHERIDALLDDGSFERLETHGERKNITNDDAINDSLGESVVTGQGTISRRQVFIFSQDHTVTEGLSSTASIEKVSTLVHHALKMGAPVIGLYDSTGIGIGDGLGYLAKHAELLHIQTLASGVIPQISLIMGPCIGIAAHSPGLSDLTFMVKTSSKLFVTGPDVIKPVTNETISKEALGGASVLATKPGVADRIFENDIEALLQLRQMFGFLSPNNKEQAPIRTTTDPVDRNELSLDHLVPVDPDSPYDMQDLVVKVVDEGDFFELQPDHAENIITGFARIEGQAIGIVANQPMKKAGCLDDSACIKAARFIRYCDAYNIPIVTFVDTPGFLPGTDQAHGGIVKQAAKLVFAYAESTVPTVTIVTNKAYGNAYEIMASKPLTGGLNYAWPEAQIALIGPRGAAAILHPHEKGDPEKFEDRIKEYRHEIAKPSVAADMGLIDDIIPPQDTRRCLVNALRNQDKRQQTKPTKKHSTMPL